MLDKYAVSASDPENVLIGGNNTLLGAGPSDQNFLDGILPVGTDVLYGGPGQNVLEGRAFTNQLHGGYNQSGSATDLFEVPSFGVFNYIHGDGAVATVELEAQLVNPTFGAPTLVPRHVEVLDDTLYPDERAPGKDAVLVLSDTQGLLVLNDVSFISFGPTSAQGQGGTTLTVDDLSNTTLRGIAVDVTSIQANAITVKGWANSGQFNVTSAPEPDGTSAVTVADGYTGFGTLYLTVRGLVSGDNLTLMDGGGGASYYVRLDQTTAFTTTIKDSGNQVSINGVMGEDQLQVDGTGFNADTGNTYVGVTDTSVAFSGEVDGDTRSFVVAKVVFDSNIKGLTVSASDEGNVITADQRFGLIPTVIYGGNGGDIFSVIHSGGQLDLEGGSGDDSLTVQAVAGGLLFDGNGGRDAVNIGQGDASQITGTVTLRNEDIHKNPIGDFDLTLDDSQNPDVTQRTVTVSDSAVTGLAPALLTYIAAELHSLTIDDNTNSSFDVLNTPYRQYIDVVNFIEFPGTLTTTLNSNGTGGVRVEGTSGPLQINDFATYAPITVGHAYYQYINNIPIPFGPALRSINGDVSVAGPAVLTVNDSNDPVAHGNVVLGTYPTPGEFAIQGLAPATIYYGSMIASVAVNGTYAGQNANVYMINDTPVAGTVLTIPGASATVLATSGYMDIEGASTVRAGQGTVQNIKAELDVNQPNFPNLSTALELDDSADPNTANVTMKALYGSGAIAIRGLSPRLIAIDSTVSTTIDASTQIAQTFTISDTPSSGVTHLNAGPGTVNVYGIANDISIAGGKNVLVGNGSLANILGRVTVASDTSIARTTALVIDASGSEAGSSVDMFPANASETYLTGLGPREILFQPYNLTSVLVKAGFGKNQWSVAPNSSDLYTELVGGETDSLFVHGISGQLKDGAGTVVLDGVLNLSSDVVNLIVNTTPAVGDTFTLIDNKGAASMSGVFDGLPEGTTFGLEGEKYQISYVGGPQGNDVVLTHINSPPGVIVYGATPAVEGSPVTLTGVAVDPDIADTLTLTVAWGDGLSNSYDYASNSVSFTLTHTYAEESTTPYTITVGVTDHHGAPLFDSTTVLISDAPIVAVGLHVTAVEGSVFTGAVASMTDSGTDGTSADYSASIAWGDGLSSPGTIVSNGQGGFSILGTHTYAEEGNYSVSANLADVGGSTTTATGTARVTDAALHLSVPPFTVTLGQPITNALVGTFTDDDPGSNPADYSATVTWGDGEVDTGAITANGNTFNVTASKVDPFSSSGSSTVSVTVTDTDGGNTTAPTWNTASAVPTARFFLAAATGLDGRFYAIGGSSTGTDFLTTLEARDPVTGTWATLASMPTPRLALAAVTGLDGRIYAIGGIDFTGSSSDVLATVEAYDPASNTWATVASMPAPRAEMAAVLGADGRIYILGGENGLQGVDSTVFAYTPSSNTWTTLSSMPTARYGLAAAVGPDGTIYVIGGIQSLGPVTTVEAYHPTSDSWTTVAGLPQGISGLAAVTGPDGRIYAIGGFSSPGVGSSAVYAFNPGTNNWTQAASLNVGRFELAAAVAPDGSIYAVGGEETIFAPLSTTEILSIIARSMASSTQVVTIIDPVPAATLDINSAGLVRYTASTGVANDLTVSLVDGSYQFNDTGEAIVVTGFRAGLSMGSGTNTVTIPSGQVTAITVDVVDGNDTVNLQSLAVPVSVTASLGGNDTFNFGSVGSSLAGIQGLVSINAPYGHNTLNIFDQNTSGSQQYSVTGSTVSRSSGPTIDYYFASGQVNLFAGSGANVFNVEGLSAGTPVTIATGSRASTVNVSPVAQNLDNIASALTINGNGADALIVNDQATSTNQAYTVTSSTLTRAPVAFPESVSTTITYTGLGSLALYAGSGSTNQSNVMTVQGTSAGTPVNLHAGTGYYSNVYVQANASPVDVDMNGGHGNVTLGRNGIMAGIQALVNVHDSKGTGDSITIFAEDGSDPTPRVVTVDDGTLTGLSAGPIQWTPAPNAPYEEGGVQELNITGGSGGNTFNVNNTSLFYDYTWIVPGTGLNKVNIRATTGTLYVQSEYGGQNVVTAGSLSPSLGGTLANILGPVYIIDQTQTALTLDDSGDVSTAAKTVTFGFDGTTYHTVSGLAPATFHYVPSPSPGANGGVSQLSIYGGQANDSFNWSSSQPTMPVTIDGGGGTNTLTFNDQATTAAEIYTVTATTVGRTGSGPITYAKMANLALYGGTGGNVLYVNSTAAGTTTDVYSGTGPGNVNEFWPSLTSILGPLNLHGQSGSGGESVALLYDAGNSASQTYTLTTGTLNRTGMATITYDGLVEDVLYTSETAPAVVNVQSNGQLVTYVVAGAGDPVTVGSLAPALGGTLANIQGALIIESGYTGQIPSVVIDDSGDKSAQPQAAFKTDSYGYDLSGLAPGIIYFSLDPATPVKIKGGAGNDTFTLANPLPGTEIQIDGGGGTNTLAGPSTANTWAITGQNSGTLDTVAFANFQNLVGGATSDAFQFSAGKGVIGTINGGTGTATLDYSLYTTGVNVNLMTGSATGTGGVSNILDVTGSPLKDVITGNNANNVIRGNGGKDILLGGGSGNHTFILSATQTSGATVIGGTGSDTLVGANVSNTWTLTGPNTGTVHGTQFTAIANLQGGTALDTFRFLAGGSVTGIVDGGGGSADTLDYSGNGGGEIAVNLQTQSATSTGGFRNIQKLVGSTAASNSLTGADVSNAWTITAANAGTVNAFGYKGIEYLVGGKGVDVFKFSMAGTEAGINGGGAPLNQGDWLDYSSFTMAVTVNLATGAASNVNGGAAGSVSNIQNLHGGNAGSTLTGNAQGNILVAGSGVNTITGGSGRSLLIGGKGASAITGGSGGSAGGGDILIAGSTSYDTMTTANESALMAILAEWQSADSLATRFTDIDTGSGGGLNGSNKLNYGTTVVDNGKSNRLTAQAGAAAVDWFFANTAAGHTTIANFEGGEHKNNT